METADLRFSIYREYRGSSKLYPLPTKCIYNREPKGLDRVQLCIGPALMDRNVVRG